MSHVGQNVKQKESWKVVLSWDKLLFS